MIGLDPNGGGPLVSPGGGGSVTAADITDSTSVGRSVLTATDAAAARTAIGVTGGAGTLVAPTFETGQGWTLVDPSTPGEGVGSFEVVSGAKVGRLTVSSTGWLHGLTGPRIERKFPQGVESWKATVRIGAQTGSIYAGIFLRDASGATAVFAFPPAYGGAAGKVCGMTPTWNIDGPGPAGEVVFDGTCFFAVRGSRSSGHRRGSIDAAGVWHPRSATGYFEPTHIGVLAFADAAWAGTADFSDFTLETFG